MADPNSSQPNRSPSQQPDDSTPEIVEAEVVDDTPHPVGTGGAEPTPHQGGSPQNGPPRGDEPPQGGTRQDSEDFRQYQQFLEFQKFQEWQRLHGGDPTTPPAPPTSAPVGRPWWKRALRLLRFKLVRRLLYLVLALLLVNWTLDYYFGSNTDGGGAGTPESSIAASLPNSPEATVLTVYDYIATAPEIACALFAANGKQEFADSHGAPDCVSAARQLHSQVTDPRAYKSPDFGGDAVKRVGPQASVSSCRMSVQGGPRLGKFGLIRKAGKGWIINGHKNEPGCAR